MKLKPESLNPDIDLQAFYRALGVFLVLLAAFALSWGAARGTISPQPIRADAADYVQYAWNLKYNGTYSRSRVNADNDVAPTPDAIRSPGYPLFLAPLLDREQSGEFVSRVKFVQSVLFVLIVATTFFLSRQFMPFGASLAAAALTAISPHLVNSVIYLLTETLFSLVTLLGLLVLSRLLRRPGLALGLLAGLVVGYGALIRPSLQFLPLALLPLLWIHLDRPLRGRVVASVAIGFLIVTCAWGIRNLNAIGQWSDSTLATLSLKHGTYPSMMYEGDPASYGQAYRFDPTLDESSLTMGQVLSDVRQHFKEEPGTYFQWYLVGKPLTFWQWDIIAGMGDVFVYPVFTSPYSNLMPFRASHALMEFLHWPMVLIGAAGCLIVLLLPIGKWLRMEEAGAARLTGIVIVYFTAMHMVVAPYPRYSVPLRPELYVMAMLFLVLTWRALAPWLRQSDPGDTDGNRVRNTNRSGA